MTINRISDFFQNPKPKAIPRFDFEDALEEQREQVNSRLPIDPRLWTQGATINENTAFKFVCDLLNKTRFNPFAQVNDEILDYYDEDLKSIFIKENEVFKKLSAFIFQGDEDKLKDQSSLLALKIKAQRGIKVTAQDLMKALTQIKL